MLAPGQVIKWTGYKHGQVIPGYGRQVIHVIPVIML